MLEQVLRNLDRRIVAGVAVVRVSSLEVAFGGGQKGFSQGVVVLVAREGADPPTAFVFPDVAVAVFGNLDGDQETFVAAVEEGLPVGTVHPLVVGDVGGLGNEEFGVVAPVKEFFADSAGDFAVVATSNELAVGRGDSIAAGTEAVVDNDFHADWD